MFSKKKKTASQEKAAALLRNNLHHLLINQGTTEEFVYSKLGRTDILSSYQDKFHNIAQNALPKLLNPNTKQKKIDSLSYHWNRISGNLNTKFTESWNNYREDNHSYRCISPADDRPLKRLRPAEF